MIRISFMDDFGYLHSRNFGHWACWEAKEKKMKGKEKEKATQVAVGWNKILLLGKFHPPPQPEISRIE